MRDLTWDRLGTREGIARQIIPANQPCKNCGIEFLTPKGKLWGRLTIKGNRVFHTTCNFRHWGCPSCLKLIGLEMTWSYRDPSPDNRRARRRGLSSNGKDNHSTATSPPKYQRGDSCISCGQTVQNLFGRVFYCPRCEQ